MIVCFVGSLISSGLLIVTKKNLGDFCNGILATKVGPIEPKLFKVDIVSKTFSRILDWQKVPIEINIDD